MNKINLRKFLKLKNKKVLILNIFQAFAYTLSICGLIYYVNGVVQKYLFDPYIGISESHRQVHEIPFPAITICSPVVLRSELVNMKEIYKFYNPKAPKNLSISEQNYLFAKAQICNLYNPDFLIKVTKNKTEDSVVKLLQQGSPKERETFAVCGVNNKVVPCFLIRSVTDVGLCYTFNMQSHDTIFYQDVISKDFFDLSKKKFENIWSIEKGYSSHAAHFQIPQRAAVGLPYGFIMQINKADQNDLCISLLDAFKIILHLPNEIPTNLHDAEHVDLNTALVLKISAKSTRSEIFLKKYLPETRKCYFEDERKLKFFKVYTKNNCNFECLTNFTLRRCGCVSFFHPRNQSTPVCDLERITCSRNALTMWPHLDEMSNTSSVPCLCYPTCSNIEYHIKKKKVTELGNKTSLYIVNELAASSNYTHMYAVLQIEFGDFLIKDLENYVGYKLENLIADCGGLFGLFLGFSFTTVIKFIRSYIEKDKDIKIKTSRVSSAPRSSSTAWITDIDNKNDLNNLLLWQMQARDRAFKQRHSNYGKFNV